jgi:hypothetical protein
MQDSRLVVRGISLENLELWKDKFSFTNIKDLYFSASKSLLFLTVNSKDEEEFITTFDGIKWKGDVLRVSSSIFPKFTPFLTLHNDTHKEPNPYKERAPEPAPSYSRPTPRPLRIRRNRKIIKITQIQGKKFFKTFEKNVSVKELSWPLHCSCSDASSDSEESTLDPLEEEKLDPLEESISKVEEEKLRGLFTLKSDFSFEFIKQDVQLEQDVKQEVKEDIIKSFSENSQFFFNFKQLQGIFKREQVLTLSDSERKEYTLIYKKRHKDASRRKNRFY